MKKLLLSVLALAGILAVSCNKEVEAPVAPEHNGTTHTVTLKAAFAQEGETRTEYANNKTFSWVEGDVVYVRCTNEADEKWYWAPFTAETSGATTDLTGEVDDGYEPYDVAVYVPGENYISSAYYNESSVRVVVPISYHEDGYGLAETSDGNTPYWNSVEIASESPLSRLPLVSVTKDDVLYFQTAMGALKINLTDVPAEADHVRITCGDDGALGNYLMVQEGEIRMSEPWSDDEGQRYATSFTEYYFQPVSDGKVSFVMPFPVGTLVKGSVIDVMDASNNVLFSKSFKKDVVIARNKIVELAELSTEVTWETLGTGKFVDNYLWEDMGIAADTYVDVEIQKNANEEGYYRIVNPYGAAAKAFGYQAPYKVNGPQDFVFHIMAVGEKLYNTTVTLADQIYYSEVYTGVDAGDDYIDDDITGDDLEYVAHHPGDYRNFSAEEKWGRNLVAKYGADGNPANVIAAPIYLWGADGYWTGNNPLHETNNVIQILFPGVSSAVELDSSVAFGEVTDDTPEQAVASASINLGNDVVSAKVVIAADLAAAKAAIAANTNVTEVTASGDVEVLLPANAPTGDYMVFAYTQAKDGFTEAANQYIYSASFKYFNSNDDAGYTLADIVGVYDSDPMHIAYYTSSGWNWGDGKSVNTITIEESDDDFLGNIMITEIECTAESRGYTLVTGSGYGPVYGTFNTATGEVLIPLGSLYWENAGEGVFWVGDREDDGTDMFMDKPGHLTMVNARNYLGVVEEDGSYNGYIYRILGGYSNYTYNYTRRSSAPVAPNRVRRASSTNFVEIIPGEAPSLSMENDCKVPFGVRR